MPMSDARCSIRHRQWHEIVLFVGELMLHKETAVLGRYFQANSTMATLLCLTWLGALWRPGRVKNKPPQALQIPRTSQKYSSWSFKKRWINLSRQLPFHFGESFFGYCALDLVIYAACILCKNHYTIDILVAFGRDWWLIWYLSTEHSIDGTTQLVWSTPLYNAKRDGPFTRPLLKMILFQRGLCFSPISMQEITPRFA